MMCIPMYSFLGPALAEQVMSPEYGYYDGNPAVFTEFSTAAYRMGHSQVKSFVRYNFIWFI